MNPKLRQLREKAMNLPLSPGVYIMKNKSGEIIYIGKAKALKNRVSQYFGSDRNHQEKVRRMVSNVDDFDYILTSGNRSGAALFASYRWKSTTCILGLVIRSEKRYNQDNRFRRTERTVMDMEKCIEIQNLQKSFGAIHAVNNLSLQVETGQLFAFLGVNGAGKSTTISMICGQLRQDAGQIYVNGRNTLKNMNAIKQDIGVVFQNSVLDRQLSVQDNLKNRAALYGITGKAFQKRLFELDDLLELRPLLKQSVGKLSGGQRRRIDIARAIFHRPQLLILDEPTTGLDPQTRQTVWNVISVLQKKKHMTVFLTTHYMEEAAGADRIVILDEGKIAAEGTPLELKNRYTGDYITLYHAKESAVASLQMPYETYGEAFRISVPDTRTATKLIVQHPELFQDYEIMKGRMDDVFLAVTGKTTGGADYAESHGIA